MTDKQSPISAFLNDRMRAADIDAKQLSEKLGFRRPFFVERWLAAKALPPLHVLARLAGILNASSAQLLVVWVMTQDYELAMSLKQEVVRKMPAAKRRAAIRKVLVDQGRATEVLDPINEGQPGDDV